MRKRRFIMLGIASALFGASTYMFTEHSDEDSTLPFITLLASIANLFIQVVLFCKEFSEYQGDALKRDFSNEDEEEDCFEEEDFFFEDED